MRNMAHRTRGGGVDYTVLNLQMTFTRPKDNPAQYGRSELGDDGTETPAKLLEWLSSHPSVSPVLDSTPLEVEAYMD
jgi:hypothetical protein